MFYIVLKNHDYFFYFHIFAFFCKIQFMKTVDETTLSNLLQLSRLSPESTDMATLKKQVDEIVGYFDILSEFTHNENPYDAYPSTQSERLREDDVVKGLDIPDVKKISEEFLDGYFRVPKVLGEGA